MRQIGSLLVRLNLETRSYHAEVDKPWLDLIEGERVPSRHAYMQCLLRAYGFDSPLEAALRYTKNFDQLVDMTGRYRAGFIAQDLLSLGLGPAQVAIVPQLMIAPFANLAEALGWLYVHERATLAHQTLRHELCLRLPELEEACAYAGAYDGQVGARIDDLGLQLEQLCRSKAAGDAIIAGAHDGFRQAIEWLRAAEPLGQTQRAVTPTS
ncbi:MAG: biliverdin-producing heme oxygenase [Deltaproteobacteria bacterium]|nr:biliverdin-producing heme oxygenase [Deltaproteobacteria bacterium]